MSEFIKEYFWLFICVFGSIYLIFSEVKKYLRKREIKKHIKFTKVNIVEMKVINKDYVKGQAPYSSVHKSSIKYPDSFIIELEYLGKEYKINDESIYNNYNEGDYIKLKLTENIDEHNNLISYKIDNAN